MQATHDSIFLSFVSFAFSNLILNPCADDNVCCAALARPSARPSLSVTTAVGKGGPQLARETGKIWISHDFWGLNEPCAVFFWCFAGLNRLEWYWWQRRGGGGRRRRMWWRMVLGGVEKASGDWGGIVWVGGKREREPTCLRIKSRWADVESDKPQEWAVCCCCCL